MAKKDKVILRFKGFRLDVNTGLPLEIEVQGFSQGDPPKKKHIMVYEVAHDQRSEDEKTRGNAFLVGTEVTQFTPNTIMHDASERCKLENVFNILLAEEEPNGIKIPYFKRDDIDAKLEFKKELSDRAFGMLTTVKVKQINVVEKTLRNNEPVTYHNLKGDVYEYDGELDKIQSADTDAGQTSEFGF